ncbi:MAG TPA: prepilin-type N-terminal cleavage/methylation domain-containing protein [Sumerlaeia bacterium]|nr:prepilin-type N-terminal cleavage/methylation domain-containing protein [Sumerlaeia bacterium]
MKPTTEPKIIRGGGFTLIELLIVVAIIAILAAIAVPNFLEAQTRSKVSKAYNDIRQLKTALEAYRVDNPRYPPDIFGQGMYLTWTYLTTPIAYITSMPYSPFEFRDYAAANYNDWGRPPYDYAKYDEATGTEQQRTLAAGIQYVILCAGPDHDQDLGQLGWDYVYRIDDGTSLDVVYDPTNGTKSSGDIIATNKAIYGSK